MKKKCGENWSQVRCSLRGPSPSFGGNGHRRWLFAPEWSPFTEMRFVSTNIGGCFLLSQEHPWLQNTSGIDRSPSGIYKARLSLWSTDPPWSIQHICLPWSAIINHDQYEQPSLESQPNSSQAVENVVSWALAEAVVLNQCGFRSPRCTYWHRVTHRLRPSWYRFRSYSGVVRMLRHK